MTGEVSLGYNLAETSGGMNYHEVFNGVKLDVRLGRDEQSNLI